MRLFADLRNFLPNGVLAELLIIFGDDFKTFFPIWSKVLNKELNTSPIPLPFCNKTPL